MKNLTKEIQWVWQEFNQITGPQMYEIFRIRQDIFLVEQQCIYADIDGLDPSSLHLSGLDTAGEIVTYARLCPPGSKYDEASIGRLLTIKRQRGYGLARHVIALCLDKALTLWGSNRVRISAQLYLREFYAGLGFKAISNVYDEDGIPHIDMMLSPEK